MQTSYLFSLFSAFSFYGWRQSGFLGDVKMQTLDPYLMMEIDLRVSTILLERGGAPDDVPLGELITPELVKEAIQIEWEGFLIPDMPDGVTGDDVYELYENTRQLQESAKALCGMVIGASFGFGY